MPPRKRKRSSVYDDFTRGIREGDITLARDALSGEVFLNDLRFEGGHTALMVCVRNGYEEIAQLLLKNGSDVHARCNKGHTALHHAVRYPDIVKVLIEGGADINAYDPNGVTALMLASEGGCIRTVELLLEKGANVKRHSWNDWQTALICAARSRRGDDSVIIDMLVEKGDDRILNSKDYRGSNALMYAAYYGNTRNVESLIRHLKSAACIDFSDKNKDGMTALALAAKKGHEKIFHMLATPEEIVKKTKNGLTPLGMLMESVKKKSVDYAKSVQAWLDEEKEKLPDQSYLKMCELNQNEFKRLS
jgi:ankyrin repeat protein